MNNAVFLLGLICIALIAGADSDEIACPRQVTGKQYRDVSFQCFYSPTPKANKYSRKFCCLQGSRPGRCKHTVVSDSGYASDQFLERIQLVDSKGESFFTVTIVGLKKEDQGTYICGIGQDENGIKGVLSLSVVEDSQILEDAVLLYAELRGSVVFKCNYNEQGAPQRKFLCKVTEDGCLDVIDSTGRTDPSYEGRVSADVKAGTFTVKMVQVHKLDAVYYTCGSDNPEESKDTPKFDLRINEVTDIPQGSRLLTPRPGGSLSAQCNYNPKKSYTEKFWCKLEGGECNPIVKTDGYVKSAYEGTVLIHDNSTSGQMQVLMTNISSKDEGWYWCVMIGEKHDQTSAVQVRISQENLPGLSGNTFVQVPAGDPAKITCYYPCRYKSAEKYWCRWRNDKCEPLRDVEDTQESQLVTCQTEELVLTLRSVSEKDSGYYWCGVKDGGRYGESITSRLIVVEPSRGVSNVNGRANLGGESRNVQVIVTPASPDGNKSGTVTAAVVSVCAAVLVVCAVFLFIRLRRRKNSDLVSVGSYRTNISMSDLDNNTGKENPAVIDLQETDISRFEDSPKTKKKGSRENLDYSGFLVNSVTGNPEEQVVE
ncbi:polymeric immunoglobulin receptor-like [Rana temporaria]|uniref:polymeric immunoglobulin receptor-like n=1 Tax=Rana temporaria TaxID=8407 RepID=UPI001AADB890|nr:polymeric immunoglobulin receptor-like [Rana temporaria]XP_040183010.1 polymeric immunoglobulin receptor-like [Rana temporaria]